MEIFIAPEIPGYAESIIKSAFGTRAEIRSFRWGDGGGLYNKVYCLDTTEGSFILKIECDGIFPSTRKGQIENEIEGSRLFKQAGILCPPVIAYDFTGKNVGVRYILTECLSDDWPVMGFEDRMDAATTAEINRQAKEIFEKISAIRNTHYGSLLPDGPLGWHRTWAECYRAWFNLLITDCISIGLFIDDELAAVYAAAGKPTSAGAYNPTLEHGDLGWHNMIWGHAGSGPDALYVYDFGNARYLPPHLSVWGYNPFEVPDGRSLDNGINLLLLYDFERMLWKEAEKLIEDYAHIRDWMAAGIEKSKKDTSRSHITAFVEKCRAAIQ